MRNIGDLFKAILIFIIMSLLFYILVPGVINPIISSIADSELRYIAYGGEYLVIITTTIIIPLILILRSGGE